MENSIQFQSDSPNGSRDSLRQFVARITVLLTLCVGVPIAVIVVATIVCVALPDEWQFGSVFMVGLIIIDAFPCGWCFSGLGCWVLGRRWTRNQSTYRFLDGPLENWGLIMVGLGLLFVGAISILAVEIR